MHRKIEPLLCELHAHTMWSDGALSLRELVDLYGRSGFDVLCVTDHVTRTDDPWLGARRPAAGNPRRKPRCVPRGDRSTDGAGAPGTTACSSCPASS